MRGVVLPICLFAGIAGSVLAQSTFESDVLPTSAGNVKITFFGHASLLFEFEGKAIYVDPWSKQADYAKLPKADAIFVTHEHFDHLDPAAIQAVRTANTIVALTAACTGKVRDGLVMKNGDTQTVAGVKAEAVPAYNLANKREDGQPFHPKGVGNGYILTFGDKRIYVAGDTENTPEMKALKNIDVAFLPMNMPYTMTPDLVADAARAFKPKILYPYHTSEPNPAKLTALLKDVPGIEIRVRKMR